MAVRARYAPFVPIRMCCSNCVFASMVDDMSFKPPIRHEAEAVFKGREKDSADFVEFEFADHPGAYLILSRKKRQGLTLPHCDFPFFFTDLDSDWNGMKEPSTGSLHGQTWPYPRRRKGSRRRSRLLLLGSKRLFSKINHFIRVDPMLYMNILLSERRQIGQAARSIRS